VPDDLTHRLDSLHEMVPADLGRRLRELEQKLTGLVQSAQKAATAQKEIQRLLEELERQAAKDRAARERQYALTALLEARADYDRQFGHHQVARRTAAGMLQAMTAGTVSPAALLAAAEHLMIDAPGYWLSPALVALAAWAGDSPGSARRAVLAAVHCDLGRSVLFFSLVLARFGRQDTAACWITEYARAQDCNALTGEFTAVLDAVARGALGGPAREHLLDACRGWRDQIRQSGPSEARQVASWTGFIDGQRKPLTETFDPLETVSHDWPAARGKLEAMTAFGHTEQWLQGRLARPGTDDETPGDVTDGLLHELIAAPDQTEGMLLEAVRQRQAAVTGSGHPPPPGEPARTDLLSLATAIATGTGPGEFSASAMRFCLMLSATSVEQAVTDLSQQVRSTWPASIEVSIEGWHHALEPGADPAALEPEFLDWMDAQMAEAMTQASRRRLPIRRSSARLEDIESSGAERRERGREAVYHASLQVNRYYQKWQQGIAAAERCVSLLRAQRAGRWSDAPEPGPFPGLPRPVMKLPDWDPRPPCP